MKPTTNQTSLDLYLFNFILDFSFGVGDGEGSSYFILVQKKQVDLYLRVFLQSYSSGEEKKAPHSEINISQNVFLIILKCKFLQIVYFKTLR